MPTYDYRCRKCGYTFGVEQSMLDRPLTRCRKCGGRLEKLLPRSINLIFKGSGFYTTDYKRQASGKPPQGEADKVDKKDKGTVEPKAEK